jgi:hypothetical protein
MKSKMQKRKFKPENMLESLVPAAMLLANSGTESSNEDVSWGH